MARVERIRRVLGYIAPDNHAMLDMARCLGFTLKRAKDDPTIVEAAHEI